MDLMADFRRDVLRVLSRQVPKRPAEAGLETPPGNIGSDLAFPCFMLAKGKRKDPAKLAKEISGKLKPSGLVGDINFYGPYINFYLDWKGAASSLISGILKEKDGYGRGRPLRKRVMVEYSAPNTNKPLHLGHLKNGAIGMSVARILEAAGYDVVKANLYNDRGMHVCKTMVAYRKWGRGKSPPGKPDHFLGKLYVRFESRKGKRLEQEAQECLRRWEAGDRENLALWKMMSAWAEKGFDETYRRFGSEFDVLFRESEYWDKAKPVVEKGRKKGVIKEQEDGSVYIDLEKHGLGRKVIIRADGTHIYVTNDLALTPHKFKRFRLHRSVWVVGSEQITYFKQLFKIFELLGFPWAKACEHLSFGLVHLPEGKMKSREGRVVDADDIIDRMQELSRQEILKRDKGIKKKELEQKSLQIGLAALKYHLLKADAVKDTHFDPKASLAFEGDTGPYIQYSHARAMSILRKAGRENKASGRVKDGALEEARELALLKQLADFPAAVQRAASDMRPHYIAGYAFELATRFNEFYQAVAVLKASGEYRSARIALVKAVAVTLRNALFLLGIEAPERM